MAPILMAFGYELPVAYVVFVPGLLRPGQSRITTPRKETDTCRILSGLYEGMTTGTSICVFVPNTDQRGHDYSEMSIAYRPSHADATYDFKYGLRAIQGGGRSSARETIGRVAAGALAKKILKMYAGTEILAYVSQVHKVVLPEGVVDNEAVTLDEIESNIVRCPDPEYAQKMIEAIDAVRVKGESVGGVVTCIARNVPRGLGCPVFDKLEADLAKAMLSLPATKGFEFGSGFAAVPMVEAMVALVLLDQLMAHTAQCGLFPSDPALQQQIVPAPDGSLLTQETA
ncbi:Chorismate synthase [Musa troglodytarum]|uniref:chorismate synthase n=1 Tax=Musa troglodytarum TaxID=320322 RepID=A0A9E7EIE0_9LILI|nr:Chorismate synthase [Musa troglodytarum]